MAQVGGGGGPRDSQQGGEAIDKGSPAFIHCVAVQRGMSGRHMSSGCLKVQLTDDVFTSVMS